MLTLYYKPTCPYSHKVMRVVGELDVDIELLDIRSDPAIATELIERGGKRQTPYLVDSEKGAEMYESNDIVEYLRKHYVH